ncbi:hypothetical protein [uncultured Jatrophihabitans sp.]|uniref:hypothetical protein n=1 Tax=uncultured Jatrophihabitans sp. TaxID=1610747 RepID=UPI0035CB268C
MPSMQYNTGNLRTGSQHATSASASASEAADALSGAGGGSPFGDVDGGDSLHGAVGVARNHHQVGARTTAGNANAAAARASGAARLGDHNTDETTRLAPRSAPASAVREGM